MMRIFNFQSKVSANRNKNKEIEYINSATSMGFVFLVWKTLKIYFHLRNDDIALKICELIAMVICTILIGIIAHNIRRKQVFIKTNARLVQVIGWVIVASGIAIPMIFDDIHYAASYPIQYLMLLGFFIVAIGYVFQLAIKMKEEQELTI